MHQICLYEAEKPGERVRDEKSILFPEGFLGGILSSPLSHRRGGSQILLRISALIGGLPGFGDRVCELHTLAHKVDFGEAAGKRKNQEVDSCEPNLLV